MKKYLLSVLSVVMVIMLSACMDKDDAAGADSSGEDLTIGISTPSADHGWMGAFIDNAEKKGKEIREKEGIDYILTSAGDPNKQANDIEDLISQDVDVIVIEPIESAALTPTGDRVKDAGIPLITVDRELESDAADVVVKGDNEGIGENAGKYFLEQFEGKGKKAKVVEISGNPSSVTKQRGGGFHEAIEDSKDIEIITSQNGDFTKEKSLDVMQNVLQSHDQIDAIFTQDDGMAEGVMQAIKEAGRDDIQFITGAGGNKAVFKDIKEGGLMKASFLYSPTMIEDALDIAVQIAKGEEPEEELIIMEATEINEDNVDEYYDQDSKY